MIIFFHCLTPHQESAIKNTWNDYEYKLLKHKLWFFSRLPPCVIKNDDNEKMFLNSFNCENSRMKAKEWKFCKIWKAFSWKYSDKIQTLSLRVKWKPRNCYDESHRKVRRTAIYSQDILIVLVEFS